MTQKMFVAETKENGAIACVWVAERSKRSPSIFDTRLHSAKFAEAECFGAPRNQIAAWLASHDNASETKHN